MLENKNIFRVNNAYDKAMKNIEDDYAKIFNKFAKDGSLSPEKAKLILRQPPSFQEVQDLRLKLQGITDEKLYRKMLTQINSRAYAARLTRLEVMKQSIDIEMNKLAQTEIELNKQAFENIMLDNYNRTMFDVQKGIGLGFNFTQMDPETIQNILKTPWSGDLFSNRVWKNTSVLSSRLQDTLISGFISGASNKDIARDIQHLSLMGKFASERLVRTESNYFAGQASLKSYEEADIDKYRYLATLDTRTSEVCQKLDRKVFEVKDAKVGVNMHPMHPHCRSSDVPYFEGRDYTNIQRRAVDADGNSILVPANMNYEEWAKKYLSNDSKSGTIKESPKKESLKKEPKKEKTKSDIPSSINSFKSIYDNWDGTNIKSLAEQFLKSEGLDLKVNLHNIKANGQCTFNVNNSKMDIKTYELNSNDKRSIQYKVKTAFHELFHAKSHNLEHDFDLLNEKWAYYDDIFAETTSHYISNQIGASESLHPSYASHLVDTLPKLKQLDEFSNCKNIVDFGRVGYDYRYGNKKTAKWYELNKRVNSVKIDMLEYKKSYISYIKDNKDDLFDKWFENSPGNEQYKDYMIKDLESAIENINNNIEIYGNEKLVFDNLLITAMDRKGFY